MTTRFGCRVRITRVLRPKPKLKSKSPKKEKARPEGRSRATISVAPDLLARFEFRGTLPRSVIVVSVESVYFQCPKALVRSELWNPEKHISRKSLPSTGTIIGDISAGKLGGEQYDREYPERLRKTLY